MYHGEASIIAQDDLNNFLAVAEDLKVKGLAQANSDSLSNITSSGHKVKLTVYIEIDSVCIINFINPVPDNV